MQLKGNYLSDEKGGFFSVFFWEFQKKGMLSFKVWKKSKVLVIGDW